MKVLFLVLITGALTHRAHTCDPSGFADCLQKIGTALTNTDSDCSQLQEAYTCLTNTSTACEGFYGHASSLAYGYFFSRYRVSKCDTTSIQSTATGATCSDVKVVDCLSSFVTSFHGTAIAADLTSGGEPLLSLNFSATCSSLSEALRCIQNITSYCPNDDIPDVSTLLSSAHQAQDRQCVPGCNVPAAQTCLDTITSSTDPNFCTSLEQTESCYYGHLEACSTVTQERYRGDMRSIRDSQGQSCTDTCDAWPCLNAGTCIVSQTEHRYFCTCMAGFYGKNCGLDLSKRPEVTSVYPLVGPQAGGTVILFMGDNFPEQIEGVQIGSDGLVLEISKSTKTMIEVITTAVDATYLNVPQDIIILFPDDEDRLTRAQFTFRKNPTVNAVHPQTVIPAGGLTLTVDGSSFDSVAKPLMEMFSRRRSEPNPAPKNNTERCILNCDAVSSSSLHCVTPALNLSADVDLNDVYIEIGLIFDGMADYTNLSATSDLAQYGTLTVMENPNFPIDQQLEYYDNPIEISGENIGTCCHISEYKVYVQSEEATVVSVTDQYVTFQPPAEPKDTGEESQYQVKVVVGTNLEFNAGTVAYKSKLPVWIIAAGVCGGAVVVAALVFTFIAIAGLSKKRRRAKGQSQRDTHSETGSDSDKSLSDLKLDDFAYTQVEERSVNSYL